MKKIILILALHVLLSFSLFSQESYKSCLNNGLARWSILCDITDYGYKSEEFVVYGDTLINGYTYKKVFLDGFVNLHGTNEDWQNYEPNLTWQWGGYFLRESEDASQVFLLSTWYNEEEYLVCDLNLEVGDIFKLRSYEYEVDSVYIKDGLKHVQLYGGMGSLRDEKFTFIEGMVSNAGFLYPKESFGFGYILNCFQNDILFYKEGGELECYQCGYRIDYVSMQKEKETPLCRVFFSGNEMLLLFDNSRMRNIRMYDLSGNLIYSTASANKEVLINTRNKGIFIIHVQDKTTNQTYTRKVML